MDIIIALGTAIAVGLLTVWLLMIAIQIVIWLFIIVVAIFSAIPRDTDRRK